MKLKSSSHASQVVDNQHDSKLDPLFGTVNVRSSQVKGENLREVVYDFDHTVAAKIDSMLLISHKGCTWNQKSPFAVFEASAAYADALAAIDISSLGHELNAQVKHDPAYPTGSVAFSVSKTTQRDGAKSIDCYRLDYQAKEIIALEHGFEDLQAGDICQLRGRLLVAEILATGAKEVRFYLDQIFVTGHEDLARRRIDALKDEFFG